MRRGWRAAAVAVLIAAATVATAPAAWAQTGSRTAGAELAAGALVVGAMSLGSSTADLLRPDGGPLTLFRSAARLNPAPGLELHVSAPVTSRVSVEATGTWVPTDVRTRITDDFEDVPDATLTTGMSRFSVEGSLLATLAGRGARTSVFIRAGAGWMREVAGGAALAADGVIGNIGAGVKYWWGTQPPVGGHRLGVRVDGRAVLRWRGLSLGATAVRVAPAASADLLIGF
jgi:hypothetical protein